MEIRFVVGNEYIDVKLGRRVLVGEELELSAERANAIKAMGVRLTPIRERPPDTAAADPKVERAVKSDGRTRRTKV